MHILSHILIVDKTAPNVAFEYGGDQIGEEELKEIEIEEKKQLLDSTVSAAIRSGALWDVCVVSLYIIFVTIHIQF